MSVLHIYEEAPQVFEFMERAQAGLPEGRLSAATEVAVATPNLIRGLEETTEPADLWTTDEG